MKSSSSISNNWVALCATTITALAASGCASEQVVPESDYTSMCQDSSYVRLEDRKCESGTPDYDSGSMIMFISTSSDYRAPAVGGKIDQGRVIQTVPDGKTVQKAAIPSSGGVVKSSPSIKTQRGGLGSSSGGSKGSSGG